MKKSLITYVKTFAIASMFIFGVSSLQSCAKKGCTDPTADNFDSEAEEDDETCEDPRPKFVGSYNVTEDGITYSMNISTSSASERGIIMNTDFGFGVAPFNINANVSQATMTIPSQLVQSAGATFQGSGNIAGNTLTITYSVSDGSETLSYVATAVKQ
jgi:hypothetical protein